jgi:hypothetical protein
MFGSLTCGATVAQLRAGGPSIHSLHAQYKKRGFKFFLVYTREPHPGENILQPTTIQERVKIALRLKKEEKLHFTYSWIPRRIQSETFIEAQLMECSSSTRKDCLSSVHPGPPARRLPKRCTIFMPGKKRKRAMSWCGFVIQKDLWDCCAIAKSARACTGALDRRRPRILLAYSRPKVNADKGGIRQSRFSTPNQFEHGSVRVTDS